jgi:hypothetical protein
MWYEQSASLHSGHGACLGGASAENVSSDVLLHDERLRPFDDDHTVFPLTEVHPGDKIPIPANLHRGTGEIVNVVKVSWDEAHGRETRTQTIVPER